MADDYRSDSTTTGRLAINGQATGNFELPNDQDWFKVTLTAGTTYLFALAGAPQGGGTLGVVWTASLQLLNSAGGSLVYTSGSYDAGLPPVLYYTVNTSGTYYLSAASNYQTGTYTLKSSVPAADDFAANIGTTGTIADGVTVTAVAEVPADVDWFRFHAEAGQVIDFTATAADGSAMGRAVYDSNGSWTSGLYGQPFIATTTGDYFLSVDASIHYGAYTVREQVIADDYTSINDGAGAVAAGGQSAGALQYSGDSDRFLTTMQAGQFYTVTVTPGGTLPLNNSVYVFLRDSSGDGSVLDSSYSTGVLTVKFLVARTGTYALDITSPNGGDNLSYTIKMSLPEADDFGDTRAAATAIELGATTRGRLQSDSDIDMFKVTLKAGVTYGFDLPSTDADTASYYGATLSDANGVVLRYPSYSGSPVEKSFTFTATRDGTYYLAQAGRGSPGDADINYSVKVATVADDHGASAALAGKLAVGGTAKGELEAGGGDVDWYAVSLKADGYYWFTLTGAHDGGGTLAPPWGSSPLRLLDAGGNVVATNRPSYDGKIGLLPATVATSGTYYVEVASPGTGTYTVKAQLGERDDYGNDTEHARAIAVDTVVNGKIELTTDQDVFKFTATRGQTFAVEVTPGAGSASDWLSSANVYVGGTGGNYVSVRDVNVSGKIYKVFETVNAGDYTVTLGSSYGYNNSGTGAYALTVKSLGTDDYAASARSTGHVAPGAPAQGAIGIAGDNDWIKVSLEAGRSYAFDLQGAVSGHGTLDTAPFGYASMTLLTSDGYSTGFSSNNYGVEPRMSFIANKTGEFFINVTAGGDRTGGYTLVETVTSGDTTAPRLLASSLTGDVDHVATKPVFVLSFDEIMMLGSGISLTDAAGAAVATPSGTLATAIGSNVVINPGVNLKPGATYTLNLPAGSLLDLAGNQADVGRSYSFTVKPPVAVGTGGNDYLLGGANGVGVALDGGAGVDTVYYGGGRYNLDITRHADGTASVSHAENGSRGVDTLSGVERLLFSDSAYALDIDGTGGQVFRLYQGAFNRAPAQSGLGFWMAAMDGGTSLVSVASDFIRSAEFTRLYGSAPSDAAFVKLLYNNVLHRDPLPAGQAFWTDALDHGVSRAQVLVDFSESAENTAALATLIGDGFAYTPYG
nr:DUF4214 domain-containing protein [uncultured Duganella sp.]